MLFSIKYVTSNFLASRKWRSRFGGEVQERRDRGEERRDRGEELVSRARLLGRLGREDLECLGGPCGDAVGPCADLDGSAGEWQRGSPAGSGVLEFVTIQHSAAPVSQDSENSGFRCVDQAPALRQLPSAALRGMWLWEKDCKFPQALLDKEGGDLYVFLHQIRSHMELTNPWTIRNGCV